MARILVIEDEPGTRLLLQSRLEDLGHEVATAPTGAMGLMEARAGRFDLFLVDVVLGAGVDGYEVCRRLKAMPQTHGVPVVLASGKSTGRDDLHRGYQAGCESFLIKGDMALLEDVVRAMLRIKSLQDDLAMQNRLLEQQNRDLQDEKQRGADLELALRETGARSLVFRELAAGRPDGVLLVDSEGIVRSADRGAHDILGKAIETKHLGRLAPASGLEAFVRDARTEPREGFRFDLSARAGHQSRSLTASVMPLVPQNGGGEGGLKAVLLLDSSKRKVAAEMLRLQEQGIPRREFGPLLEAAHEVYHAGIILGISPAITELRRRVASAALADGPLLVRGAEGTGKDLVARSLHFGGTRSGSFVPVNCGALSPPVLESELFGHIKGAFTGAFTDRPGLFHQAHMGTVFLNGIDALPLDLQNKLLVVLEHHRVQRVGAQGAEDIDVRVLASTAADIEQLVSDGLFSAELYERISADELRIPAISERPEDIPVIAAHFLQRYGSAWGVTEVDVEAAWVLSRYHWPGNVRELRDTIERSCARAVGACIGVQELPQQLRDLHRQLVEQGQSVGSQMALVSGPVSLATAAPMAADGSLQALVPDLDAVVAGGAAERIPDDEVSLDSYEKLALLRALEITGGDKLAAARLLNVGKSTLYRKLKRHDIG